MQRHAMLMYTSCGWFFDELSGIETVQVLHYAGRVIQLARETGRWNPEPEFLRRLALAQSNLPEMGDGASIYNRLGSRRHLSIYARWARILPSAQCLTAITLSRSTAIPLKALDYRHAEAGTARLALGLAR